MRTVTINKQQIKQFASTWPCANLEKVRAIVADFADNGDLVDLVAMPSHSLDHANGTAVSALIDDARDGKLS